MHGDMMMVVLAILIRHVHDVHDVHVTCVRECDPEALAPRCPCWRGFHWNWCFLFRAPFFRQSSGRAPLVRCRGDPPPPPVPWTLNVYSARALCFLGFFPKTNFLFLGSRLALQRGRRSTGSLCGERGHEEETVNILTGGRGGRHGQGRGFGTFCWERGGVGRRGPCLEVDGRVRGEARMGSVTFR